MCILLYDQFFVTLRIIIVLIFKCKVSQVEFVLESFLLIEDFLQQFVHTTDSVFTFHLPSLRTVWRSSRTSLSNPICRDWMLKENVLIPKMATNLLHNKYIRSTLQVLSMSVAIFFLSLIHEITSTGVEAVGAWDRLPHPHLVPKVIEKSKAIPLLTLRACVAYKMGENLPTWIYVKCASPYINHSRTFLLDIKGRIICKMCNSQSLNELWVCNKEWWNGNFFIDSFKYYEINKTDKMSGQLRMKMSWKPETYLHLYNTNFRGLSHKYF